MTDDQKAMLRLLAQREEGYEDMAALMGISVEEVRARVKEALAEVDQAAAEPVEPESTPAPAAPPVEPEPPAPAPEPQPAAPAPATPPAQPQTPSATAPARGATAGKRPSPLPKPKMPKDRGALIGLSAGALVLVIFAIVLLVAGDGGSSDSSSSTTPTEASQGGSTPTAAEEENLTQATLLPTNGGDASGQALFGKYKKSVLLQVKAEGLDPSPEGKTYTVWLYRSPKVALQIGALPVGEDGKMAAQFQIPAQLLAYVANGDFSQVDVSLTSKADYQAAFAKAKSERKLPPYIGESVLRGEITGPTITQQ